MASMLLFPTLLGMAVLNNAVAQSSCVPGCNGTTADGHSFDLSALMGVDFMTLGHQGDKYNVSYHLNVCGTSHIKCPDDAGNPPVTEGMAVQTLTSDGLDGCFVLGAYEGYNCLWTSNPGGQEGIQLSLDDGSNDLCTDGSPRGITIDFLCPASGSTGPLLPASWTATNLPDSCEYVYTFETCAACDGGCTSPPVPVPAPAPAPEPEPPAAPTCQASCSGTTADGVAFDLSSLMGSEFQTSSEDGLSTYFLSVCGGVSVICPEDGGDPAVTEGMAVQQSPDGGCYVLGQYSGGNCIWTSNPGGVEGIELTLDDGSNYLCADGAPRQITVDFLCPASGSSGPLYPASWTATNLPDSCMYKYTFETCAACDGGCSEGPLPPAPAPAPEPAPEPPPPATCKASCAGTTADGVPFDLSSLTGKEFKTLSDDGAETFYLSVCGAVSTVCPEDPGNPSVTEGMAIQTNDAGACNVLGEYTGGDCVWTSNPGGVEGIQLILDNGSNNGCTDGAPRQIAVDFLCPASGSAGPLLPASWTASKVPESCMYTYTFETCAACQGGCTEGPIPPEPSPEPAPAPASSSDNYPHALVATLAVFCGLFGSIVVGAAGYVLWQRRKTQMSHSDSAYVEI